MSAWTCHPLMARPSQRSLHLVLGSHDGRALVPIPKRSASPRVTSTSELVDSLKALDPNRPIREADIAPAPKSPFWPSLWSRSCKASAPAPSASLPPLRSRRDGAEKTPRRQSEKFRRRPDLPVPNAPGTGCISGD